MGFENELTIRKLMISKGEDAFHENYENAIKNIKSLFGKKYDMVIDGKYVKSSETFVHTSPIDTRIILGYFPNGNTQHVQYAIEAAKKMFEKWRKTDYRHRLEVCRYAANIIVKRKFELAAWVSYENGKNRYEAIADIDEAIDFIRYYSEEIERNNGFVAPTKSAESREKNKSTMKPYGVWAVIAPFNFPAAILVGMSIGALITGNTVVLKPASDTPIIGYLFTEIMKEAGLPDGVLNFITGPGETIGKAIIDNHDVDGIIFTGSKQVGYKIIRGSTKVKLRSIIGEMGGKNPVIVTEHADLDKSVEGVLRSAFGYSGQKCSACSRVYIHKNIKNAFTERLVHHTRNLSIGNPLDSHVFIGPLINLKAYNNYQKYSRIAFRDGKVLVGGAVRRSDDYKYGYYIEPTIVDNLPNDHRLFREELFVPILCLAQYDDFNEALKLCNESSYGLTAGIYSNKKQEIEDFLDNIEAGVVYVNRPTSAITGAMVGCQPFGGWKDSGTTAKGTGGQYYLAQFLREQSQTIVE
jgi:1-pyrroline-5-carboxylate dehydrogenase